MNRLPPRPPMTAKEQWQAAFLVCVLVGIIMALGQVGNVW
jgi:hypothetical protein